MRTANVQYHPNEGVLVLPTNELDSRADVRLYGMLSYCDLVEIRKDGMKKIKKEGRKERREEVRQKGRKGEGKGVRKDEKT